MVAAEEDARISESKAQMVRGMPRRMHRLEAPFPAPGGAPALHRFAVLHHDIGDKIPVAAFLDPGVAAPPAGMRPEAMGRRAGRRLQRPGGRRMVAVGMGDEDVGDLFVGEAGDKRVDVLGKLGPGIDER